MITKKSEQRLKITQHFVSNSPKYNNYLNTFAQITAYIWLKGIYKLEIILIYRYNNLVLQIV
jgi:hypothetical protein